MGIKKDKILSFFYTADEGINMLKAVLFDLDGSLLPMDQDYFVKVYFDHIAKKFAKKGYSPDKLISAVWQGTKAMVKNDGSAFNEEVFWRVFAGVMGKDALKDKDEFNAFYETDFKMLREYVGFDRDAGELVRRLKRAGLTLILASNPVFPLSAQKERMRWAGVDIGAFSYFTSYENSTYCKPNPLYYAEIAEKTGFEPSECLMIGNDAEEDMTAKIAGMNVFLLPACLINRRGLDISAYPQGGYMDAYKYALSLLNTP